MLNLKLGSSHEIDGHPWIVTAAGRAGFALYGPYAMVQPGRYVVEFRIELDEADGAAAGDDPCCAVLDIAADGGKRRLAQVEVRLSQLSRARGSFAVPFDADRRERLEFRAWASGAAALRIADDPRLIPALAEDDAGAVATMATFPSEEGDAVPFFSEQKALLRTLYDQGRWVRIHDGRVVLTVDHVSLFCDSTDDMAFIGEVFDEGAYNLKSDRPVRVFDIGMNVGLTSLLLASKAEVRRVHSFEPFRDTFDRAMANLRLNPRLAAKIDAHNVGLSDRDTDDVLRVTPVSVSGAANVIEVPHGEPVHVRLRDAGTLLAPLIAEARAAGERVVVKVDCEGSEFAVFASLARRGLLEQIDAFMVEWHAMFEGVTQEELIAPLRAAGFLVFDRSPRHGNGFFYAVRLA